MLDFAKHVRKAPKATKLVGIGEALYCKSRITFPPIAAYLSCFAVLLVAWSDVQLSHNNRSASAPKATKVKHPGIDIVHLKT